MSDKKIVNIQLTKAKSVAAVEIGKSQNTTHPRVCGL